MRWGLKSPSFLGHLERAVRDYRLGSSRGCAIIPAVALPSASMPRRALMPGARPWLIGAGLATAVALRLAVGGVLEASSTPGALGFAAALILLALAAGWRP